MQSDVERHLRNLGARGRRAVVAGIAHGDEQVLGWRGIPGERVDPKSLFEIGSITKVFTGVLLADMVLAGEVALEDGLSLHLSRPRPAWRHREPTLLELATHRSGLPNTPGPMARRELAFGVGLCGRDPWAGLAFDDYAHLVERESPRRAPGRRARYSSLGVGLLGDALAARAGTTYDELLTERVLAPLGMRSTSVQPPPALAGQLLRGHSRRGRPRSPLEDFMAAAGSLRSNAEDMLRFLSACVQPPSDSPGPALALAQRPHARIGRRGDVGLCWMMVKRRGHPRIVWHNGGTWGFRSFAAFAPQTATAAVVLSNTTRSVDRVGFGLVETRP